MQIENEIKWRKLAGMRIAPEGAALSFEARLAREQGWSPERTGRVMEEYRRFLYLAATAARPVTPSKAVDEAWHLHLTYTRHYWDQLCGRILERPLHHEPSEGGAEQGALYRDQYRLTLEAYRRTFGEAPPADVWPAAQVEAPVFEQPQRQRGRAALRFGGAATAAFLLAACTALTAAAADAEEEGDALLGFIIIGAFVAMVYFVVKRLRRRRRGVRARRAGSAGSAGSAGGAYGAHDSNDRNDSSDSDGGPSCGGGCGGGGD